MKNKQTAKAVAQNAMPQSEAALREDQRLLDLTAEAEKRRQRNYYLLCFGIPLLSMLLMHILYFIGDKTLPVLVLDMNAQYISFFEKFRDIILEGESILYAFDRNLGGEFMGIFAYYLSSPFSLLVALFPKTMITEALCVIYVLKTGFCGLTFGYFLNKMRKMPTAYAVMFSSMYALCAFAVVMQHNLMWIDNLIALPLLVVGIEALIKEGKYRLYVISLVYCMMSNFYIGYMICIFVFIYFFVRYFMLSPKERNPKRRDNHFFHTLVRMGIFSIIALAISMVIILPAYYSLSFGKFEFSDPKYEAKQLFKFLDLLTKVFFGSYDSVRPEGMPFVYCGMLMPMLLPLYFFNPHFPKRKKVGFGILLLVFVFSFNHSLADYFWHGMQRPNWLNARFAFIFAFIAVWMTAEAFMHLKELSVKWAIVSAVAWAAIMIVMQKFDYSHLPNFKSVWPTLLLLAAYCVLLAFVFGKKEKILAIVLSSVVCLEMLSNGLIMLVGLNEDVVISTKESYRSVIDRYSAAVDIIEDDTFYRAETLYHRKKNDNMALDLNGLTNSTSTLNARTIDFLGKFGFASKSHWTMYSGATPVSDALFGIKYIIADENASKPVMDYIHRLYTLYGSVEDPVEESAETTNTISLAPKKKLDVYQNPYALSIAYEVDDDILNYDPAPVPDPNDPTKMIDNDYVEPFAYMNDVLSAMLGREHIVFTKVETDGPKTSGVKTLNVVGNEGYEKTGSGTPKLTYTMTIENEMPVFLYFPSEYPREVSLTVNGTSKGQYLKDDTHAILELGSFNVGDTVDVVLELKGTNLYLTNDCHYFWYYDEEAFIEAAEKLAKGNLAAYSESDDEIYGKITVAEEDSVIFTTIPYEEGWKVYVDGKRVETTAVLNGSVIAFDCPVGEHDIRMVYRPKAVTQGVIISLIGIAAFAFVVNMDYGWRRKNGKWVRVKTK